VNLHTGGGGESACFEPIQIQVKPEAPKVESVSFPTLNPPQLKALGVWGEGWRRGKKNCAKEIETGLDACIARGMGNVSALKKTRQVSSGKEEEVRHTFR